ncbi:MAG: hemolysin family protein [Prevotellaceae bacterium]|jgi:CBS domain containing-hemolysin-like protein|nr:hemolysin family protein [Prevotellaceae bacterium]
MDSSFWFILVALLFSAFFSGLEISFLSSNKLKVEIDRQQGKLYSYLVSVFLRHQGQFITSILVGNNVALVIYSIMMTKLLNGSISSDLSSNAQLAVNTVISTAVVLLLGEFLPKTICRLRPNFFMRAFSIPAFLIYLVCFPVARFTTWLAVFILRHILRRKISEEISSTMFEVSDLQDFTNSVVETVEEREEELENDIKLFQNALDFAEVKVRACMVPRTEIVAIELEESVQELLQLFVRVGFSRILVYKDTIDNIIGYVRSTDLFKPHGSIRDMLITLEFVPESMSAQQLLALFIKKKKSMAVVVDEFGGTAGMVAMEDVMEEIFGEIEDEHDCDDLMEKQLSDTEFVLAGRLEVTYLNEQYGLGIPESDEYETLAGFIIFGTESIPKAGEEIALNGFTLRVLRTSASKIDLVHLTVAGEKE